MNEWIISIFMILRSWATLCHAGTENCDAMHLQTANAVITFYWLWSFSLWSGQGMYSLTNTDFKSYIHSVSCNSSGKYIGSTNSARYTDRLVRTVRPPAHILLTFTSTAASKCCVGIMQSVVFRPTLFFSVWWARWDLMKSMKLQTYEKKKVLGLSQSAEIMNRWQMKCISMLKKQTNKKQSLKKKAYHVWETWFWFQQQHALIKNSLTKRQL